MYVAGTPPQDPAMLPGFLLSELRKLQEAMSTEANMLLLETLYVASPNLIICQLLSYSIHLQRPIS